MKIPQRDVSASLERGTALFQDVKRPWDRSGRWYALVLLAPDGSRLYTIPVPLCVPRHVSVLTWGARPRRLLDLKVSARVGVWAMSAALWHECLARAVKRNGSVMSYGDICSWTDCAVGIKSGEFSNAFKNVIARSWAQQWGGGERNSPGGTC